jgi:hypothetical protein
MQLKQFFLKDKTSTIEELNTLEKIIDSIQMETEWSIYLIDWLYVYNI